MRLPWPFGRGTTSGAAASEPAAPADTDPAFAPSPPADAPATGAWASLPAIQRTVGAVPLVAPTAGFLGDVPGTRPLPPIVQPLGHESTPTAPSGLVAAHATPVATLTSSAPLPTRHVQRRTPGGPRAAADGWAEPEVEVPSGSPAPALAPEPAPIRRVAAVSAAATVTPPVRPLTVAPSIAPTRAAVAQRTAAAAAPTAPTPSAPAPNPAAAGELPLVARGASPSRPGGRWSEAPAASSRAGLGAPVAAQPAVTPAGTSPVAPASSATLRPEATAGFVPVQRTPAGAGPSNAEPSRRAGLGAPMHALPATAQPAAAPGMLPLAQRTISAEAIARAIGAAGPAGIPSGPVSIPMPVPAAEGAVGGRTSGGGHEHGPDAGHEPGPSVVARDAVVPARALPVLPVARQRGAAGPAAVQRAVASGTPAGTTHPAAVAAAASSSTMLPLAGARPLRPALAARHDAAEPAGDVPETPVVARWATGGDLPGTVNPTGFGSRADVGPVALQRLASTPSAALVPAGTAQASGRPDAALQRETLFAAPGWSAAGLPAGVTVAGPGVATPPVARSPVQRSAPATPAQPALQLARPPAGATSVPGPATAPASPAPDGRIEAHHAAPAAAQSPTVQTSGARSSVPVLTATPVVQRVDGAAPPPSGGATGQSDRDLDELSRKLFGRMRGQIRAEIINEREARGLSFDAF